LTIQTLRAVKTLLVPLIVGFFTVEVVRGAALTNAPVADTTLFEVAPDNNLGRSSLAVGSVAAAGAGARGRALLRFDLSAIPVNAVVESASLRFTVIQEPFGAVASSFGVHRFLKPWTEGTGAGNQGVLAQNGETTWRSQFHGSALWPQPGSTSGSDYVTSSSGSVDVSGLATYAVSDPGIAVDVQAWVSGAATNHGWIMISDGEGSQRTARRLGSRESLSGAPSLEIQYTVRPSDPMPRITSAAKTNNQFELRFAVPSTYCYEVQFRDSLTSGAWAPLTNVCASVGDLSAIAADPAAAPQRFYRLFISGRSPPQ
jgi:hypothetical protein